MTFDGVFTHAMINELTNKILNGRLSKIHQPYDNEIILVIRSNGKNHKLLLSAHPNYARIQLTTMEYQNPATAPNFCMLMRKYLEGSLLTKIEQIENDRIVHMSFSKRNELGDLEQVKLVIELMGRHSNIILINDHEQKILDCIKHIGPGQNSYRTLLPGANYISAPSKHEQFNPFTIEKTKLFESLVTAPNIEATFLQENFQGLGRPTANELSQRLKEQPNNLIQTWREFWQAIDEHPIPTLSIFQNKEYFTPLTYATLGPEVYTFPSLSELLDMFYEGKAEKERFKQQAGELIRTIENEAKKALTKAKKLENSLIETENAEDYRQKGELLTTFLHNVPKGAKQITLENYYDDNQPITISLREDLSPAQNAQKYFQKYGKLKNGVKIINEQLENAKKEYHYLESVLSQLELASPMDVDIMREELISERYIRPKRKDIQRQKKAKSKPEKYIATDGTTILVGKNNLQNDQLTFKIAEKNHIWLHAKDIPGSHVIVQSTDPSADTLKEAAMLAAYFSKYRLSASVPVDYVAARHVKKPNGAKPGFVIYDKQHTLFVTPDKELVTQLKV